MMNKSRRHYLSNFLIALFVGIFLVYTIVFSSIYFYFSLYDTLFVILVSVVMYLFLIFVLMKTSYYSVGKRINENKIIDAIVKEVYDKGKQNEVVDESKKFNEMENEFIVNFVANSKSKIYHKSSCRLVKNIKPEVKLENSTEEFFKKKKFKKCKTCFKKSK